MHNRDLPGVLLVNVIPKKRAQQLTQYLILSWNLSMLRSVSILRNLSLRGKQTALRSIDSMRHLASRIPLKQEASRIPFLQVPLRVKDLNRFSKILLIPKLSSSIMGHLRPLPTVQPPFGLGLKSEQLSHHEAPRRNALPPSKCGNRLTSSLNVPDACLVCKDLISCLSKLD